MNRPFEINIQLFAEGDTNLNEKKETNLDNKPEEKSETKVNPIRAAFGLKPKKPDKEPEDKKPDAKPEEKKPDAVIPEKEPAKEPEFDEITYNKEKVKIPVTERQTYLQKGYNYDKVKADADNAKATLKKIAELEGFKTVY
jgi:hypothetical protein